MCVVIVAGMAVFDTMRHIRPHVSTACVGLAASMGAFVLASGQQVSLFISGFASPSLNANNWNYFSLEQLLSGSPQLGSAWLSHSSEWEWSCNVNARR